LAKLVLSLQHNPLCQLGHVPFCILGYFLQAIPQTPTRMINPLYTLKVPTPSLINKKLAEAFA